MTRTLTGLLENEIPRKETFHPGLLLLTQEDEILASVFQPRGQTMTVWGHHKGRRPNTGSRAAETALQAHLNFLCSRLETFILSCPLFLEKSLLEAIAS